MSFGVWVAFLIAAAVGGCGALFARRLRAGSPRPDFPWGTCVVNISGSFVLGVITGLALYHGLGVDSKLVFGTGFCGAYTTFSTFTYETVRLAEGGAVRAGIRNVAVNTAGGLLAAAAGLTLMAL